MGCGDEGEVPVYGNDCGIEGERSMTVPILIPYRASRVLAFVRTLEGVVDARDDDEKVREHRTCSIGDYTASGIVTSCLKWIHLRLLAASLEL